MTVMQWFGFLASLLLILGIALAAQLRWLPGGRLGTVMIFLAGALAMASLWMTGLPPDWFSGTKTGWIMAGSMLAASAISSGTEQERTFRRPLFLGIGVVLLAANATNAVLNGL